MLLAMLAGSLRVSTPFLFVSLGECLTEKSGRINLGNEGVLVLGAMVAYATSYQTGSPWAGVAAAAVAGLLLGGLHGAMCSLARVNDVAMGIAIMLAGTGVAFFFGKPYVQPSATLLPGIPFGFWSDNAQVRNALSVCPLFLLGIAAAIALGVGLQRDPRRLAGPYRRRQPGRRLGAGIADRPHPLPGHRVRQRTGRDRRRVPVAVLSRKLE